jgi:hypothetical protein
MSMMIVGRSDSTLPGIPGAAAMGVQVLTLMWLRCVMTSSHLHCITPIERL